MARLPRLRLFEDQKKRRHPASVRWFDYKQLAQTGIKEFLSTTIGSMMDARRHMPGTDETSVIDFTSPGHTDENGAFWFDYMSDTGDGWKETYAMAHLLSREQLCVPASKDGSVKEPLNRGRFLILGGDQVYPVASEEEYEQRLFWPFEEASGIDKGNASAEENASPGPCVFMIPGNHDWYDNLESFTKLFCGDPQKIGLWETRQKQSYFSLRLPYGWHVWGIDVALRSNIDNLQLNYFLDQAEQLEPGSRVILCTSVPDWSNGRPHSDKTYRLLLQKLVEAVEEKGQVPLFLAGDIHNYQRYTGQSSSKEKTYRQTKVVSGGGGAFLHPTHAFRKPDADEPQKFVCENRYPNKWKSRLLAFRNLCFPLLNWKLSLVIGLLYFVIMARWSRGFQLTDLLPWVSLPQSPFIVLAVFLFLMALIKFAMIGGFSRNGSIVWGCIHTVAHLVMASTISLGAAKAQDWASYEVYANPPHRWLDPNHKAEKSGREWRKLAKEDKAFPTLRETIRKSTLPWVGWINPFLVIFVGGVIGGGVFGLYLLVSLNWLKRHHNEAFASLRINHFKNFLRFKVTPDELWMYVIKIDKMPRSHKKLQKPSNAGIHDCFEAVKIWSRT